MPFAVNLPLGHACRPVEDKKSPLPPDLVATELSFSLMFPVRRHVAPCLVQVNVLIDVVDPRYRNEMMMLTVGRTQLRELNLIGPVEMVDFSDPLSVGRYDVHVFLDLRRV